MSVVVALSDRTGGGLSPDDQRVTMAILYARFRGVFSGITELTRDGAACLAVWRSNLDRTPIFTIHRSNDHYAAVGGDRKTLAESHTLEGLLDDLRARYPPSPAL